MMWRQAAAAAHIRRTLAWGMFLHTLRNIHAVACCAVLHVSACTYLFPASSLKNDVRETCDAIKAVSGRGRGMDHFSMLQTVSYSALFGSTDHVPAFYFLFCSQNVGPCWKWPSPQVTHNHVKVT